MASRSSRSVVLACFLLALVAMGAHVSAVAPTKVAGEVRITNGGIALDDLNTTFLNVTGALKIPISPANGHVLKSDADGVASWGFAPTLYGNANGTAVASFISESMVSFTGQSVNVTGPWMVVTASGAVNNIKGTFFGDNLAHGGTLTAGDKVEYVQVLKVVANDVESGQLMGVGLVEKSPMPNTGLSKSTATQRIFVGVDSANDLFIITGDGASYTLTDTGFNAVVGTAFKVRIVYVAGSYAHVAINDGAPTTITTTLPPAIGYAAMGMQDAAGGGDSTLRASAAYVRLTAA